LRNSEGEFPQRNYPSIMDYYDKDNKNLKIEGISGASAGAITAFPLALGLTSEDIEEILKSYPFSEEFLPNNKLHEGKYRMIGMDFEGDAKFLTAEDHLRKLGEDKIIPYFFSEKQKIGSNAIKSSIRSISIATVLSILYTGVKENWGKLSDIFKKIDSFINDINFLKKISVWIKSNVIQKLYSMVFTSAVSKTLTNFTPIPWNSLIKTILKLKLLDNLPWGSNSRIKIKDLIPADNAISAVGNLLWDRGIYAGFEIRDFFFKILLMSLSKNTHFKQGLFSNIKLLEKTKLNKEELESFFYKFGDKFDEYQNSHKTFGKLFNLPEILTFKVFYEITNVNLCICVTNSTTSQPIYFSHYFTPDFPVIEALGASMSFPIAFKPIYNEANVIKCDLPYLLYDENITENKNTTPIELFRLKPHKNNKRIFTEIFSLRNFNKFQSIVLGYIKQKYDLQMSINNNLSSRSFLPYLRKLIDDDKFTPFEYTDKFKITHTYDSNNMKFLCYFFYNSAFKGLLIDGGATNNLPISVFTFSTNNKKESATSSTQNLATKKNVLALKLDNSFPDSIKDACFEFLRNDKGGKIIEQFSNMEDKNALLLFAIKLLNAPKIKKSFQIKVNNKNQDFLKDLSNEARVKISKELIQEYKLSISGFTPWNKQKFILGGLINALSFGFDQGQIEDISDNENIIPLYCYGIGTLDFDLTAKQMKPLVELANIESERTTISYFANQK
jgi:predicted acylesterase/phospholipase RssA